VKLFLLIFLFISFQIWFQNKRARWRRRVNDNMTAYPQPFMPMSPVPQYGFMPGMHMMSSSPQQMGGYFNYPWMQTGSISPNNNTQQLTVNPSMNPAHSRLQGNTLPVQGLPCQQYPPITMTTPSVSTLSSPYTMTSPQQMMTPQSGRHLQYPNFLYPSNYGGTSGYPGAQQ